MRIEPLARRWPVFWPWSKAATVYVSDTQCAVRVGTQVQCSARAFHDALPWCAQVLSGRSRACTVYLGASLLQATLIEAGAGARSMAEVRALAQHRLGLEAQWSVQCAWIDPRMGALAVAVLHERLEALRTMAASAGVRALSVQPAFLTALRAARLTTTPWAIVIAEPDAWVTLEGQGRVQHLHRQAAEHMDEALPREQARARYAGGEHCTLQTYRLSPEGLSASGPHYVMEA